MHMHMCMHMYWLSGLTGPIRFRYFLWLGDGDEGGGGASGVIGKVDCEGRGFLEGGGWGEGGEGHSGARSGSVVVDDGEGGWAEGTVDSRHYFTPRVVLVL